jgi:uncharacterized protein (DUF305 family)
MKTHLKHFAHKINFWNLFMGLVVGFCIGIFVLNRIAPTTDQMLKLCKMDPHSLEEGREIRGSHNPYVMEEITTEKQFVEEMIMHHEAAVKMAQQVLVLNPRAEIKKLANSIISAQAAEIKMMKEWLANWK